MPAERPRGARAGWRALVAGACAVAGVVGPLLPMACATSASLARVGYEAEAFVATRDALVGGE